MAAMSLTGDEGSSKSNEFSRQGKIERDATRPKGVSFVSIIIFTFHLDALSLNGSVMIINQSINGRKFFICFFCVDLPSFPVIEFELNRLFSMLD